MTFKPAQRSRRDFLKQAALVLATLPLGGLLGSRVVRAVDGGKATAKGEKEIPLPAGEKEASATDPLVGALGYVHDGKNADIKRFPQRAKKDAANQTCANCSFYTEKAKGWGKCTLIQNGLVYQKGWCGSYQKKPERKG
jgi:hypothetical protein